MTPSDAALLQLVRDSRQHIETVGPDTESWLDRLEHQHQGLRRMVEAALDDDPPSAAELGSVLWIFWWQRGHMAEGRAFLERTQAVQGSYREMVLKGLGTIAFRQGDTETADRVFAERLQIAEAGGDGARIADACADLSRVALRRGDFGAVRKFAERGYAAARGLDPRAIRMPLHMRAAAARMEGKLDEARELYLESRELNERLGNDQNVIGEDHNLGHVALHSGDRDEAERRFRSAREWIFNHDNAYLTPYAYLDAGVLALHDGDLDRACRLVSVATRIFEETDSIPDPDDRVELDSAVATLQARLGERFDAVAGQGRALAPDEARALANQR